MTRRTPDMLEPGSLAVSARGVPPLDTEAVDAPAPELSPDPSASAPAGFRGRVVSGLRWGVLDQVVQQLTRFAFTVVATKLVDPGDFGVMALAWLAINLGSMLSGMGFGPALVQRQHLTSDHVRSAFGGSAALGVLIALAVAVTAWPVSNFFDEPDLRPVLVAMSVVFLFKGVEQVPNDLLRRALLFRQFVVSSTIATVVGAGVGTVLAVLGAGVWALVGYAVVEAFVATALAWFLAIRAGVWRPAASLRWGPLRDLLSFSGYHTGSRVLSYIQSNFDNVVVGKVIGATALGYYGLAYRVMLFPLQRVGELIGTVAFPAFSAVQADLGRLRTGYLRGMRYVAALTFPATVGLAVTAPVLVPVVFGEEWVPAVLCLQILAANGPRLAAVSLNGTVWQSIGRPQWSFATSVLNACTYVPAFLVGSRYGIEGVAWGFTVAGLVSLPISMRLTAVGLGVPVSGQLANLAPVAAATALMAGFSWAVGAVLEGRPDAVRLVAMVAAGAVAYGGGVLALCPKLLGEFARDLRGRA